MPIETSCDGCGQHLRVQDVHAGKLARCPACNAIYRVPIPDGLERQPQAKPEATSPVPNPLATIPLDDDEPNTLTSEAGSAGPIDPLEPGSSDPDHPPTAEYELDHADAGDDSELAAFHGDSQDRSLDDSQDLVETAYPADTERTPPSSAHSAAHSAAPSVAWRMRTPEGTIYGPVPQHEIDAWVREGRVSADCQLSENGGAWFWADQMYPQLRPAPQAAPAQQPYVPPRTARTARLPSDRGAIVLALGIMGWVIVCPFISLAAWIMGASDLRDMNAGRMMRTNMGMTQVGRTLGMLHVILTLLFIFALIFFGM